MRDIDLIFESDPGEKYRSIPNDVVIKTAAFRVSIGKVAQIESYLES